MLLTDIRKKYPQYNDLPDAKLTELIHKKFYPDMNENDLPANEVRGWGAIPQAIKESISSTPQVLKESLSELPSQIAGAIYHHERIPANLTAGLGEGAIALLNAPGNAIQWLAKKGIYPESAGEFSKKYLHIGDLGIEKKLGIEPKESGDALIRGLSGFAIPGKAISSLLKGSKSAFPLTAATLAMGENQDPIHAALLAKLLSKIPVNKELHPNKAFHPATLFRSPLSKEQLQRNLDITKGTETSLGQVIDSPTLNRIYENVLPYVIGSGAEKTMQRTGSLIQQRAQALLSEMGGEATPLSYSARIQDALKNASEEAKNIKNEKFESVNSLAEKQGIKTQRNNLRQEAKSILKEIKKDPDLENFTNAKDIGLLSSIISNKKQPSVVESPIISPITNKPIEKILPPDDKDFSLKTTGVLRGKIGENAHEAAVKGEHPKLAIYNRLRQALDKDVQQAIENSGSPELEGAHKNAMRYYKDVYSKFLDPDITKFTREGGDPDLIVSHFLRGGKGDRAILLSKLSRILEGQHTAREPAMPAQGDQAVLLEKLMQLQKGSQDTSKITEMPPQKNEKPKENILAYSYLTKALDDEGNINPVKLHTLYHKLGPKQKQALFGNGELYNKIKDLVDLVSKNKESFNLMFNPKTGARNTELLAKFGQLTSGVPTGTTFLSPAIIAGLSNLLKRGLTSEKIRNYMVKHMKKNK